MKELFKTIWKYLKPFKKKVGFLILASLLAAVIAAIIPSIYGWLVDQALNDQPLANIAIGLFLKSAPALLLGFIIAAGILPNSDLARDAGLEVSSGGAIVVNREMQTSDPDIYAGGDCVEVMNLITGKPGYYPLGGLANKQGRVIGTNLAGGEAELIYVATEVGIGDVAGAEVRVASTIDQRRGRVDDQRVGLDAGPRADVQEPMPLEKGPGLLAQHPCPEAPGCLSP